VRDRMEEIFSLLEELKETLREEKQLLKKLDHKGLMNLLPRKLFLVDQIERAGQLGHLKPKALLEMPGAKEVITEIKALNETNKIFAEESLSLVKDFLSVLLPKNYRQDGKTQTAPVPSKGVTLNMEA